jgi:hypothetical protein
VRSVDEEGILGSTARDLEALPIDLTAYNLDIRCIHIHNRLIDIIIYQYHVLRWPACQT